MKSEPAYATEAALCAAFIEAVQAQGWQTYPETSSWDVLCVRADGTQVGVQAKLKPNLRVLAQAVDCLSPYSKGGPHFMAVLLPARRREDPWEDRIPRKKPRRHPDTDFEAVAEALGVIVFRPRREYCAIGEWGTRWDNLSSALFHRAPLHFEDPCWVPPVAVDVPAGVPCPVQLTAWKVQALRLLARLELRGYVVRQDFREIGLAPARWQQSWLEIERPESNPPRWIRRSDVRLASDQHPEAFATILELERARMAPVVPEPIAKDLPLFD